MTMSHSKIITLTKLIDSEISTGIDTFTDDTLLDEHINNRNILLKLVYDNDTIENTYLNEEGLYNIAYKLKSGCNQIGERVKKINS